MEDKTRKLIMALEVVALLTAGILILIDYKLKQDLIKLFERIESAIEHGQRLYSQDAGFSANPGGVPRDTVVGDNPTVETSTDDSAASANGNGRKTPNRRTSANGNRGTRNTSVPQSGESVGP